MAAGERWITIHAPGYEKGEPALIKGWQDTDPVAQSTKGLGYSYANKERAEKASLTDTKLATEAAVSTLPVEPDSSAARKIATIRRSRLPPS